MPIVSFEHRGLSAFWTQGSKAGIQPEHASRLRIRLDALNAVTGESDVLALPVVGAHTNTSVEAWPVVD